MKKKKRKTPYEVPMTPLEAKMEIIKLIPNVFRRRFKAGDIVALKDSKSVPFILKTDEYKAVETIEDEVFKADDLVLICPVENRVDADRKEVEK